MNNMWQKNLQIAGWHENEEFGSWKCKWNGDFCLQGITMKLPLLITDIDRHVRWHVMDANVSLFKVCCIQNLLHRHKSCRAKRSFSFHYRLASMICCFGPGFRSQHTRLEGWNFNQPVLALLWVPLLIHSTPKWFNDLQSALNTVTSQRVKTHCGFKKLSLSDLLTRDVMELFFAKLFIHNEWSTSQIKMFRFMLCHPR